MGWVTVIGPAMEQVDYRLQASAGCSLHVEDEHDAQVDYRLGDGLDEDLELTWIGEGLREVGIEPGTDMDGEVDRDKARALMSGVHPGTGEVLVAPRMLTDPRGKLPAGPLVAAIVAAAQARDLDVKQLLAVDEGDFEGWAFKRFGTAERGLRREGEVYRISFRDAVRLARVAGVDLAGHYSAEALETARKFQNSKVRVGLRGFDVTVDLDKGTSGLWAIAPTALAKDILTTHKAAITEGFAHFERWVSYTKAGHNEGGSPAAIVPSCGLLGWLMPHQVARPVDGAAPDPHVHTHIVIAHLAHAEDGKWRTIGAGGRDVHRMAHALDSFIKARFRDLTAQKYGFRWAKDPRTGQWTVVGVPVELRDQLSKRGAQVARELKKLGISDPTSATRMQAKVASATSREAKAGGPGPGGELRTEWRRQVQATESRDGAVTGPDGRIVPELVVAAAAPGWGDGGPDPAGDGGPGLPPIPPLPDLAAAVVASLTEHRKDFRRADVLAAVLDEIPAIDTMEHAEDLVDQVLAQDDLVAQLPEQGQTDLTHHERYTSTAIVQAERIIVESAAARYGEQAALVPADVAAAAVDVFESSAGFVLSREQRAVVDRLLTGGHGVDAVIGVAGSGKTTLMSAARTGWESAGMVVAGASTAAIAAVNLEAEAGIRSFTLASWLQRIRTGEGLRGVDVLVLDEAAMCDDRQVAELVTAAAVTGTKLVMIGDPMQLRSPGVGGSFNAVHEIVDGLVLRENRRQRDQAERAALARWRTGDRLGALLEWSGAGRVHVAEDGPAALAAMLQRWDTARREHADPFARIAATLLMAGTNADVDKLNAGARAIRIAVGEIEAGREYRRAGGGRIELSVGDVVMTRANDYRARRTKGAQMDVLNGYRGIVTAAGGRGVTVAWKDGTSSELTARYIAEGGVSHGYALTVAKAQGLTAEAAIVYGAGLDPNTLYPAMSRDRGRVDLVLPRTLLEDEDTLARLGQPASEAEALRRAINAYAASLRERDEPMVSVQLGQPLPVVDQSRRAAQPVPATAEQVRERGDHAQAAAQPAWRSRPAGRFTGAELADLQRRARATIERGERIEALTEAVRAGRGPEVTKLREQAPVLRAQAEVIEHAQAAQRTYADADAALARAESRIYMLRHQLAALEARRGPAAWGSRGERRGLAEHIAQAETDRDQARAHAETLHTRLQEAEEPVAEIPREQWHEIVRTTAWQREHWDQALRAAQDQDNTAAFTAPMLLTAYPERVAKARHQLPLIQAELALRAAMDPAERAAEDRDRAEDTRQRAGERPARRPAPPPRHRPPTLQPPGTQPGRGHGLGR
jgi:conjugative relaxase-like TrwC/TraI family protein